MIADLKPYPEYKDSGVEWLGKVPVGWGVRRAKHLLRELHCRSKLGEGALLSVSQFTGVSPSQVDQRVESLDGYRVVHRGDLVMNIMLAWNGSLGVSQFSGLVSPAYAVFDFIGGADGAYYHYLLRSPVARQRLKASSRGVVDSRLRLYPKDFLRIGLPLPPREDQVAISRILAAIDTKTKIAIESRLRLVELLAEEKQAIIHRAIARGLDPDVPLRPSGVDWLGGVPKHWEVRRLKEVARLHRGFDLSADLRAPGSVPVVSSGGVVGHHAEARVPGPGVVIGRYGSTDSVFYLPVPFWPHNTALYVSHYFGNLPRWAYWLLRALPKADLAEKAAVPGLDRNDIHELVVAVPPMSEQIAIAEHLDRRSDASSNALAAAQRQISLLGELRTRLISDVVTGKLDVREAAARLPDDPDAEVPELDEALEEAIEA